MKEENKNYLALNLQLSKIRIAVIKKLAHKLEIAK